MALEADNAPGRSFVASVHWERRFLQDHPDIGKRFTAAMPENRARTMTPTVIAEHLRAYARLCRHYKITKPEQVFNCDETGVCVLHVVFEK